MKINAIALATVASLAAAAPAPADVGAADIVPDAMVPGIAACMEEAASETAALACLEGEGVPDAARDFASTLTGTTALGVPGILVEVIELGPVDLAQAVLPALSTDAPQPVLVNGVRDVALALELAFAASPTETPGTRAILNAHPDATEASRVEILAHRVMPSGAQRFVLGDRVTASCATCEEVGLSLTYLDFVRGALVNVDRLGWFPPASPSVEIAARLEAADISVVQARLNALGYEAGPVDGVAGRRTLGAFYALKRDHCLPEDPRIRPVIPILAAPEAALAAAPCAAEIFARPPAQAEPMLTAP
ncbi:peptidoglycan-binding domain-containing protein [Roseibacterium sp. SDUM158017]|uniref:peptidoglycan-binding domain-containing protein n=1 Tax=Roseicyclus salinarum TaxID=3036773 RepID=UPI0024154235|nr:peptidoglycan-binding domain-containing protein [Roseibacterium sp. SDUM158017]MDG4649458.1 peptidoglycan-binding domain-containing protein [Roseibacterium sp. SDUM158017]